MVMNKWKGLRKDWASAYVCCLYMYIVSPGDTTTCIGTWRTERVKAGSKNTHQLCCLLVPPTSKHLKRTFIFQTNILPMMQKSSSSLRVTAILYFWKVSNDLWYLPTEMKLRGSVDEVGGMASGWEPPDLFPSHWGIKNSSPSESGSNQYCVPMKSLQWGFVYFSSLTPIF